MKKIFYIIIISLTISTYMGCSDDNEHPINRLNAPSELTATRGDTSVFLKWNPVRNASHYTLVRGLKVIADSLNAEEYEDATAPDTLTEYRVYAVNDKGWRSGTYAADSGFLGIPNGIMPRVPAKLTVSSSNPSGCILSWESGRFATSYKIYKDGDFYTEVVQKEYIDHHAETSDAEYTIYSVNKNGISVEGITGVGKKSYFFKDDFENYEENRIIEPFTFVADRIAYYTEGSPKVNTQKAFSGSKSLLLNAPKVQILHDWGGAFHEGYYTISFRIYKAQGKFFVWSSYGDDVTLDAEDDWIYYQSKTGLVSVGQSFNLTISTDSDGPLYLDDMCIEYTVP